MTIECAFHGFLSADAEPRVSKAGKNWTRLRVGVGKDDAIQWLNISVFGKAAEAAGGLKKSDRVYCEGSIKLDKWRGQDGAERHSLSVAAFKCEQTHLIGRNKPKRAGDKEQSAPQLQAPANDFNDEISF